MLSEQSWENLAVYMDQSPYRAPSTEAEVEFQALWAEVLQQDPVDIGMDDSFFTRGGDSIAAMRLVSRARARDISLTVGEIFRQPTIAQLARQWMSQREQKPSALSSATTMTKFPPPEPFTLLPDQSHLEQFLADVVCQPWDIPRDQIEDVLPATSLQEFSLQNYPTFFIFDITGPLDIERVISSWAQLVAQHDVLRTVFVPHDQQKNTFLQVIRTSLATDIHTYHTTDNDEVESFLSREESPSERIPLGRSPLKLIFIETPHRRSLVLRMCHAQYDGFSISELWNDWACAFNKHPLRDRCSYREFVHATTTLTPSASAYWTSVLQGAQMTYLTGHPPDSHALQQNLRVWKETTLEGIHAPNGMTMASFVQAAWILILARRTGKRDIVFGLLTSGRRGGRGFDTVMGPCLQMMPVRAQLDQRANQTMRDLCRDLHNFATASMEFEGIELRDIIAHCTDWDVDAPLGTWLQHDYTDWNAPLELGEGIRSPPRVLEMPYSQDDVGLETIYSEGDAGQLKVHVSAPCNILDEEEVAQLLEDVSAMFVRYTEQPQLSLGQYLEA